MLASHLERSIKIGSIGVDSSAIDQFDLAVELPQMVPNLEQASEMFEVSCSEIKQLFGLMTRSESA